MSKRLRNLKCPSPTVFDNADSIGPNIICQQKQDFLVFIINRLSKV